MPEIITLYDDSIVVNKIKDDLLQFAAYYVYEDGEESILSHYSRTAISPYNSKNDDRLNVVENLANAIDVTVNTGSKHVIGVNIVAINAKTSTGYIAYYVDKSFELVGNDADYTFRFNGHEASTVIPDSKMNALQDSVPLFAGGQKIIESKMCYSRYTSGYDPVDIDMSVTEEKGAIEEYNYNVTGAETTLPFLINRPIPIGSTIRIPLKYTNITSSVTTNLSLVFTTETAFNDAEDMYDYIVAKSLIADANITIGINGEILEFSVDSAYIFGDSAIYNPSVIFYLYVKPYTALSLKSRTSKKYAILYYDAFDRRFPMTTPLPLDVAMASGNDDAVSIAKITIASLPPEGSVKFSVLRSRTNYTYNTVRCSAVYVSGIYLYLKINDNDTTKVGATSTSIVLYSYNGVVASEDLYDDILEVTTEDPSGGSDTGKWVKIVQGSDAGYTAADSTKCPGSLFYVYTNDEFSNELYYETPTEFAITNGYHEGNNQTQTSSLDCIIDMHFDGDVYVNLVESTDIREVYKMEDGTSFKNTGRAAIYSNNNKQVEYYASITYSDYYVNDSGYNGLSTFNASTGNYVDLRKEYGPIELIDEHNDALLVLQEDRSGVILVDKSIQYSPSGETTQNVLDNFMVKQSYRPFAGDSGCQDWRSYIRADKRKVWVDRKRKSVTRLSTDGATTISDVGMAKYFENEISPALADIICGYDPSRETYFVSLKTTDSNYETLAFSEENKGWLGRYDFLPDATAHDGADMFSIKENKIYKHNAGVRCNFYGAQYDAYVNLVLNDAPSAIKIAHTIQLEGSDSWELTNVQTDQERSTDIPKSHFEKREGFWFAAVPMYDAPLTVATEGMDTNGLGVISSAIASGSNIELTFTNNLSKLWVAVGDTILISDSGSSVALGVVSDIDFDENVMVTTNPDSLTGAYLASKFAISRKNSYIEGEMIRGYYFNIKLTHEGSSDVELFAVNMEVTESKQ